MRECFWYCQIEHQLIARKNGCITGFAQHPLWVLAVHVAINVHHFGFDPNTELHAQRANVRNQRRKTLRIHVFGNHPITKAGSIVSTCAKPTIIQNKALDTTLAGGFGQRAQLLRVVVEIHGFPRVERNLSWLAHRRVLVVCSNVAMKHPRCFVHASIGMRCDD